MPVGAESMGVAKIVSVGLITAAATVASADDPGRAVNPVRFCAIGGFHLRTRTPRLLRSLSAFRRPRHSAIRSYRRREMWGNNTRAGAVGRVGN